MSELSGSMVAAIRMGEMPCPNAANHTPRPEKVSLCWAWANRMARTHRQKRCPGCQRWLIWVPKQHKKVPE